MSEPSRAGGPTDGREGADRPIIRDKRRIDPTTGSLREPAPHAAGPGARQEPPQPATDEGPEHGGVDARVAELTADVQRLSAEYSNYRKRVDRDRELVREIATANVLDALLPVLDDLDRAREHGDLTGAFKSVGEALEAVLTKLGLERFGEVGEPFDPTVHEALLHNYAADVDVPTCTAVLQPGYRFGGRIIRPARVAVTEPEPEPIV
ncbi:MAG: nucleotide exchange factor GrpE [Candidatus Nanopelagicales bacterium]